MAATGSMFSACPLTQSNPAGEFIQAFAEITNTPDITPAIPTTSPVYRCTFSFSRPQPYNHNPRAIASTKNAVPSHEKGNPNIGPACSINVGHSIPSSKLKTVPETAPTAKNIATPFAQVFAKSI